MKNLKEKGELTKKWIKGKGGRISINKQLEIESKSEMEGDK